MEISEALPRLGAIADEICLVRSMHTEHNNHTEALGDDNWRQIFRAGRRSAWVSHGTGHRKRGFAGFRRIAGSGGYPARAATLCRTVGCRPCFAARNLIHRHARVEPAVCHPLPEGTESDDLEFLAKINALHGRDLPFEPDLEARIRNFELAARMQLCRGRRTRLVERDPQHSCPLWIGQSCHGRIREPAVNGDVLWNLAFDLCKSFAVSAIPGIATKTSRARSKQSRPRRISRRPPSYRISSNADCWIPQLCGPASSVGFPYRKMARDAITIAMVSACCGRRRIPARINAVLPTTSAIEPRKILMSVPDLFATILHQLESDPER